MEHQLVDVMPPRKQEQKLAIQEINSAIKNARGEICVIVFTLKDILNSDTWISEALENLLDQNQAMVVKLLLIDPNSDAAQIRVRSEEGSETEFERSQFYNKFWSSIVTIQRIEEIAKQRQNRLKIEARFSNIIPNFYMISTPTEVFIEPYHLGYKTNRPSAVGEMAPLLRFSSTSPMYKFAKTHFLYIWESSENGSPPANGTKHDKGYIRVKSMDVVSQEIIDRRSRPKRRSGALRVDHERRSASDRRHAKVG